MYTIYFSWKLVYAGGHGVYRWEARQSGRPNDTATPICIDNSTTATATGHTCVYHSARQLQQNSSKQNPRHTLQPLEALHNQGSQQLWFQMARLE